MDAPDRTLTAHEMLSELGPPGPGFYKRATFFFDALFQAEVDFDQWDALHCERMFEACR